MSHDRFPMFPLSAPVLPGSSAALRVFEDRYVALIRDLLAGPDDGPLRLGIVMIERGHEVGGSDQRTSVGTSAIVDDLRAGSDGTYSFRAAATDRIRIVEWLDDDPYPLARIAPFPLPTGHDTSAADIESIRAAANDLLTEWAASGGPIVAPIGRSIDDPVAVALRIASTVPISTHDRQRILEGVDAASLIETLETSIDDARSVLKFRRS